MSVTRDVADRPIRVIVPGCKYSGIELLHDEQQDCRPIEVLESGLYRGR